MWLASLAALGGIAVIARGEEESDSGSRRAAIGWSVLATAGFAVSFAMLHSAAHTAGYLQVTLIARLAGFGGLVVWIAIRRIDVRPAIAIWPTLLLMGALDTGGMIAVTVAGSYARPEFAAVSSSCFGLVTILLAWHLSGELLTRAQWLGAVMVFAGVVHWG